MNCRNKSQSGFTLTELLVALSLTAIILILSTTAYLYTYGAIVIDQTKAGMVQKSQLFVRRMAEDIRLSNGVRTTNQLSNSYNSVGQWTTSDPANILIITQPATDASNQLIIDENTGEAYQNEIIYYGLSGTMYRRIIVNSLATGSVQKNTCLNEQVGCSPDIKLVSNLENLLFEFYDVDDSSVVDPEQARSIDVTINLSRQLFGQNVATSNTIRITLRNE